MSKEPSKIGIIRRQALRGMACGVMSVFLLIASAQPAHATVPVVVVGGVDYAELVLQYAKQLAQYAEQMAQDAWVQVQSSAAAISNVVGQQLQVQASSQIADTANTNARQNVTVGTAETLGVDYTRPPYYSYCHVAESSAMYDNNEQAVSATTQALVQGNQSRRADPIVNSKELKNECTLGFAPVSDPNDPEYQAWTAMGCAPVAGGKHERQDRSISAVTGPLQYLVDPNFQKPMANSTYAPITVAPSAPYYPFDAAVTFCQHIPVAQPLPPQAVSGKPTIDLLKMIQYATTESSGSGASSACFSALSKRMQFDAHNNWPADNPQPGIVTRHDEQVAQCEEDHAAFILDDASFAECQANGRSELQAAHDRAFKLEMGIYQTNVLATLKTDTAALIRSNDEVEEERFQQSLRDENYVLGTLLRQRANVYTGATSQTVQ